MRVTIDKITYEFSTEGTNDYYLWPINGGTNLIIVDGKFDHRKEVTNDFGLSNDNEIYNAMNDTLIEFIERNFDKAILETEN